MNATATLTAVEPISAAAVLAGLVRLAPIVSAKRTARHRAADHARRAIDRPGRDQAGHGRDDAAEQHRTPQPGAQRRGGGQRGQTDGHGDAHLGVRPGEHDHGRGGQQQQRLGGLTDVAGRRRDAAAPARRHDVPHRMVDPEHGDRGPYGIDRRADRDAEADDRGARGRTGPPLFGHGSGAGGHAQHQKRDHDDREPGRGERRDASHGHDRGGRDGGRGGLVAVQAEECLPGAAEAARQAHAAVQRRCDAENERTGQQDERDADIERLGRRRTDRGQRDGERGQRRTGHGQRGVAAAGDLADRCRGEYGGDGHEARRENRGDIDRAGRREGGRGGGDRTGQGERGRTPAGIGRPHVEDARPDHAERAQPRPRTQPGGLRVDRDGVLPDADDVDQPSDPTVSWAPVSTSAGSPTAIGWARPAACRRLDDHAVAVAVGRTRPDR